SPRASKLTLLVSLTGGGRPTRRFFLSPQHPPDERPIRQDFLRCIVSRRAGDAAAGMGSRAAHVEVFDRCAVIGMAEDRARRPDLVETHGAVHDVAADQAERAFEIEG